MWTCGHVALSRVVVGGGCVVARAALRRVGCWADSDHHMSTCPHVRPTHTRIYRVLVRDILWDMWTCGHVALSRVAEGAEVCGGCAAEVWWLRGCLGSPCPHVRMSTVACH